jgi:3-hydroxyacyl-CoA dehydrogenase/enoyl-CoA hydratase/3-hydroxybutyryl-CoA epimerase
MPAPAVYVLEKMSHGFNRTGGANAPGFYEVSGAEGAPLWSGLKVFERGGQPLAATEIDDRLRFVIALTLLRAMSSGDAPLDADDDEPLGEAGALIGTKTIKGWINAEGLAAFETRARELAARYGPRFEPPPVLSSLAADGKALT